MSAKIHAGHGELATSILGAATSANAHRHHIDLYDDSDDDHESEFHDKKEDNDDWDDGTIATARTTSSTRQTTHAQKREMMRQRVIQEVMDRALPDRHDIDLEVFTSDKTVSKGGCFVQFLRLMGILPSSLHDAIANDSIKQVRKAIKRMNEGKKKDPTLINALNEEGRTAVVQATIMKKTDIVRVLLEEDAELNLPDSSNGITALMYAIIMELDNGLIMEMLAGGAHIAVADMRSVTPVMLAASKGNARALMLMLRRLKHWEVDAVDDNGWTALHHAAYGGSASCCKQLLAEGAEKQVKDAKGRRPLDIARFLDHGDCLAQLEDLKARLAYETGEHFEEG